MKKALKKGISLLAAGALLATSAAAYAAQLPEPAPTASQLATSSSDLVAQISLQGYSLTADRFSASFYARAVGGQFRYTWYTVEIGLETEEGSSSYAPVAQSPLTQNGPSSFSFQIPLDNYQGQRIRVRVSVVGEAFNPQYIGSSSGTQDFYFTM